MHLRPHVAAGSPVAVLAAVLAVVLAVVLGTVGAAPPAGAVAHGDRVPEGRFGFAVRLTMPDIRRPDGTHYRGACSAALVAPTWIVSAGHCFHDGAHVRISGTPRYRVVATLGTTDVGSGRGVDVDVVSVRQAPAGHDLALARLRHPVPGVTVLALPSRPPRVGDVLYLAGWGWTGAGHPGPSRTLQAGTVTVRAVGARVVQVAGRAPRPDTSACVDDSGAPYFSLGGRTATLVSVESTGPACPHRSAETTTRVDVLRAWMTRLIGPAPTP